MFAIGRPRAKKKELPFFGNSFKWSNEVDCYDFFSFFQSVSGSNLTVLDDAEEDFVESEVVCRAVTKLHAFAQSDVESVYLL